MNRMNKAMIVAGAMLMVSGAIASAAFSDNFQNDTVDAPPPGWTISGTNGTTATANVALEFGTNKFLALRDSATGINVAASRIDNATGQYEKAGYLQFDIRFNQNINSEFDLELLASSSSGCCTAHTLEPIDLQWFPGAYNTNLPLLFRTRSNGDYPLVTNNFPIGTWQTIRIDFVSRVGTPRGTYTIGWNGVTNGYLYLDQGVNANNLAIDDVSFFFAGPDVTTASIDIDNIQFIPEPSAVLLLGIGGLMLLQRRR